MKMCIIFIAILILDFCAYGSANQKKSEGKLGFWNNPIICFFSDCEKTNDNSQYNEVKMDKDDIENLWLTDEQVINWSKEKIKQIACWFIECPPTKNKAPTKAKLYQRTMKMIEGEKMKEKEKLSFFDKAKKLLNAAKPQEPIITNLFKSEWSPYCWLSECCNKDSIPSDTEKLAKLMYTDLYGQHLTEIVIDAIQAHWNLHGKPAKPLVLSFHGSVGVGKNYLARLIASSLFKLELKSKYVHLFTGRVHFTSEQDIHLHKQNLYSWLRSNTSECSRQLFIFDEVEKMPPGILSDIKPILDYREVVDGVDYRDTIFIFISNIGATAIGKKYEDIISSGREREDIEQEDFENIITEGAFQHEGGFYNSDLVKFNLIDHYIPFLPLEEAHVRDCIKYAFSMRNVKNPHPDHIDSIVKTLAWIQRNDSTISVNGCKNLASKVSLLITKYYKVVKKPEL